MEGSKEKELKEKERQLKMKETELEVGIKHNEELRKVYEKSIEAISMLPEVQRSRAVAEMKKAHRDIEKNTRKPSVIAALTDKKD